jgi:putative ubiquitin-RnfH superfamily antitoxin RatB of RatAB toxin-antitoxin module
MANGKLITIEVAYAQPKQQAIVALEVPENTTLEEAIHLSRICHRFPEIDLAKAKVGIFSKISAPSTPLKSGDRVEIYRSLIADPKAARQQRAKRGKNAVKKTGEQNVVTPQGK